MCVCPLGFSGPSCVTLDKDKIVDKPQVVRCPSNMTGSKPAKDPPASTGPSCNSPTTSVWPSTGGGDERHPLRKHADQDGPGHLFGRVLRGVPTGLQLTSLSNNATCEPCPKGTCRTKCPVNNVRPVSRRFGPAPPPRRYVWSPRRNLLFPRKTLAASSAQLGPTSPTSRRAAACLARQIPHQSDRRHFQVGMLQYLQSGQQ